MKKFIKRLVPPLLWDCLKLIKRNWYGWHGNYSSWEDAQSNATGYDNQDILKGVRESMLKIKNKVYLYERDGVIFDKAQYSWPLLAGLMYAYAKTSVGGGQLRVCDFGGSLGSTYYQNKIFLDGLNDVSWNIVEQKHFVDVGKRDFEDERLKFYYDIQSAQQLHSSQVLILSSVLQYIESPNLLLDDLLKHNFDFIIVDRTPFAKEKQIKLQVVPPFIYQTKDKTSYPSWFFEEKEFLSWFEKYGYRVIERFDDLIDGNGVDYEFFGFIMEKTSAK